VVKNQDDCVAVTSGVNVTVTGMTCSGGHGLSIGSVGGKSNNVVTDITFSDSTITNSENGCHIKTNSGTTGSITNVVYSNIKMSGISDYGIDVQQDYLNGGPTGVPTNGVTITGLTFSDVTGTVTSGAYDYYILCGSGSCSDFTFTGVSITGGSESCNYPSSGCP
jgi:polygalacturonase